MISIRSNSQSQSVPLLNISKHTHLLDVAFVGVLAIGAFLRLFQIDATQFWNDGAGTFNLAYDVIALQGVPVTGIHSSIGTFTPPGAVYVYLLPALLGSPTLGSIETALAAIGAIALTYYICRLYLNPVIGLIATLLFSVAAGSVTYSRFIWQPNMQVPLTVLLIAAILAGVVGGLRGWLAWALPFLGLVIQMHPVTASLLVLIILGWVLAPQTVRARDLVIGGVVTIALYIPTLVYEVISGFSDLHLLLHAAGSKPVIGATVFHRFLDINSLLQIPGWAHSPFFRMLNYAWEALLVCSLLYLALRVVMPVVEAARHIVGATSWRARAIGMLAWAQAEAQSRWRADLILLLWPTVIILVQIRHTTPIEIHYILAIFPAQFIALAILLYDLGTSIPRLAATRRLAAVSAVAVSSVLVAVVCITQIGGITAGYLGPQPRTLQAEIAGLAQAQRLVTQYDVDFVIFQLDYETAAPTSYMLQTSYLFSVPTQIVSSGNCLAGAPSGSARVLYLVTGDRVTPWESILTQIPGVHDLMGNLPAGEYYRAYVVSPDQVTEHLRSFDKAPLATPISFGGTIVADHILQVPVAGQSPSALAVETHLLSTPSAQPFHLLYGLTAAKANSNSQTAVPESMYCNITPWIPQQRIYYMFPQFTSASIMPGDKLLLSASNRIYDAGNHLHIGSLRLISAYDLTSVEFVASPTSSQTFAVQGCGQSVVCANTNAAVIQPG